MRMPFGLFFSALLLVQMIGCDSAAAQTSNTEFNSYWYAGDAELSRYALEQVRYGEIHSGDAVLIFVTEPFRTDKQVKYEGGNQENVESVLKLNLTKKFYTGIYPYSMMNSTFTPVADGKPTLKVTTTSQEWCGHTFTQLNLHNNKYEGKLFSYFQDEGDQDFALAAVLLEDELWSKIRLQPTALPTGKIKLIPGSMFLRLKHRKYGVENASATISEVSESEQKYRIEYEDFSRTLEITFEKEFPHAIISWQEHEGSGNATLITRAVRTHTLKSPYWSQHDVADGPLRAKLGLE